MNLNTLNRASEINDKIERYKYCKEYSKVLSNVGHRFTDLPQTMQLNLQAMIIEYFDLEILKLELEFDRI